MANSDDEQWVLTEAAKPSGFSPNALSAKNFAINMERRGLLQQSENYPVWFITDAGRKALAETT